MAYTYDTATNNGKVRLLIQDTTEADAVFTDAELAVFLDMESDNVRRGAAMALEAMAADKARLSKRQRTLNWDKDTRGVAKELREQAASLRASEDSAPQYGTAEVNGGVFTALEIINNQLVRDNA